MGTLAFPGDISYTSSSVFLFSFLILSSVKFLYLLWFVLILRQGDWWWRHKCHSTLLGKWVTCESRTPEYRLSGCNRIEPVTWNHQGEVSDLNCERWNLISWSLIDRQIEGNSCPRDCYPWLTLHIFLSLASSLALI